MSADNYVSISGNLVADPELRYTEKGIAITTCSVAVQNRYRDTKSGEWVNGDPQFFDVTVWNGIGENLAASAKKGQRVTLTGRLQQRKWETDDGEKRSKVAIVAEEISVSVRFGTAEFHKSEPVDKAA